MSRSEIEPLLDKLFSERGIVKLILSFDDYSHDLIRRLLDKLHPGRGSCVCHACGNRYCEQRGSIIILQHKHCSSLGATIFLCDRRKHLEIHHGRSYCWSFTHQTPTQTIFIFNHDKLIEKKEQLSEILISKTIQSLLENYTLFLM